MPKKYLQSALALMLVCSALGLVSCVTASREPISAEAQTLPEPVVILEAGDVIEVNYRYWPELNQTQAIRPDGRISLQMIDEVSAGGLTPQQLDARLQELYASRLINPDITVI